MEGKVLRTKEKLIAQHEFQMTKRKVSMLPTPIPPFNTDIGNSKDERRSLLYIRKHS